MPRLSLLSGKTVTVRAVCAVFRAYLHVICICLLTLCFCVLYCMHTGLLCDGGAVGSAPYGIDVVSGGQTQGGWQYGVPLQRVSPLLSAVSFYAFTSDGSDLELTSAPEITCTCWRFHELY